MNSLSKLKQHIRRGKPFRRKDLEAYTGSVDRQIKELLSHGIIRKVSQGLYYRPKKTRFGELPPDENALLKAFLNNNPFLVVPDISFNNLGLGLTQLSKQVKVYNHKIHGKKTLGGRQYLFHKKLCFPKLLTKEFLLVELLNEKDNLAEDISSLDKRVALQLPSFNQQRLLKLAEQHGNSKTKQLLQQLLVMNK